MSVFWEPHFPRKTHVKANKCTDPCRLLPHCAVKSNVLALPPGMRRRATVAQSASDTGRVSEGGVAWQPGTQAALTELPGGAASEPQDAEKARSHADPGREVQRTRSGPAPFCGSSRTHDECGSSSISSCLLPREWLSPFLPVERRQQQKELGTTIRWLRSEADTDPPSQAGGSA